MRPFPLGLASPGPRLTSDVTNRSSTRLMAIVAEHLSRGFERYYPRDVTGDDVPETFCNVFAQDVCEAMGVLLPRQTLANELVFWLATLGKRVGWGAVEERVAQSLADEGRLALAAWKNPTGPGHLAVVVPSLGEAGVWLAQAGKSCFTRQPRSAGFGERSPTYFAHP